MKLPIQKKRLLSNSSESSQHTKKIKAGIVYGSYYEGPKKVADVTRLEDNGNLCRVRVHKLFCASQLKIGDEIDVDITSLIFGPKPFETGDNFRIFKNQINIADRIITSEEPDDPKVIVEITGLHDSNIEALNLENNYTVGDLVSWYRIDMDYRLTVPANPFISNPDNWLRNKKKAERSQPIPVNTNLPENCTLDCQNRLEDEDIAHSVRQLNKQRPAQRSAYLLSMIKKSRPKHESVNKKTSKTHFPCSYYAQTTDCTHIEVCKQCFKSIYDKTESQVKTLRGKVGNSFEHGNAGKLRPNKLSESQINSVKQFLDKLLTPNSQNHCRQQNNHKFFLEKGTTKRRLFKEYINHEEIPEENKMKKTSFHNILKKIHLGMRLFYDTIYA